MRGVGVECEGVVECVRGTSDQNLEAGRPGDEARECEEWESVRNGRV